MYMQYETMFLEAYERHADAIFRYCYYRVYDREKALDLAQETFTRVWKHLTEGNIIKNLRAFLFTTARNLIIDSSRRRRELSLDELKENGFEPSADACEHQAMQIDVKHAIIKLQELKEEYREAVYMRYVEGLKPREIAEITGESQNIISVRIHRGVKQLKTLLNNV